MLSYSMAKAQTDKILEMYVKVELALVVHS